MSNNVYLCPKCKLPEYGDPVVTESCMDYCVCDQTIAIETPVVCPVCARCNPGAESGVIYCYCRKHTEEAEDAKRTEVAVAQPRLKLTPQPADIAEVAELQVRWKVAHEELEQAIRDDAYWSRHVCNPAQKYDGTYWPCTGCEKQTKAAANLARWESTERTLRVTSLEKYEKLRGKPVNPVEKRFEVELD